ncbi:MAG: DNA primase [Bdellovibrionaceae bacterium]|nr:DNA primase [Pseudobdellovibrionaceae bacterium]MDW8189891.1 DNA primase [Pseudobdellovibrionaceae bacterium]
MTRFSEAFIQKVIEANDLVQLIGELTSLRLVGNNLMGLCPFPDHRERTPSFSVSPAKQVYHCFGCKKSGNIVTFLKDYHGLSFPEAIEFLANRARIPLPSQEKAEARVHEIPDQKKELIAINEFAKNLFHTYLKHNLQQVEGFLNDRALTPESINHFELGLSPSGWDFLVKSLVQSNISLSLAEKLQLIKKKDHSSDYYDFFRNRFMFPIHNTLGQVIGFGGRSLDPNSHPKYLNSPDSLLFNKGNTLFGLYQAARHIRSHDKVVLVEGYMDVIQLFQAQVPYGVAPMGTALTPRQAEILKRYTKNVIVVFDGDQAGVQAAIRSLPVLFRAGLYPRGIFLPNNLDPDDYIKKYGPANFRSLIDQAPDLFSQIVEFWLQTFKGDPLEKMQWIEKISPLLFDIEDRRLRELYAKEIAWKLQVSPDLLLHQAIKNKNNPISFSRTQGGDGEKPSSTSPSHESLVVTQKVSVSSTTPEEVIDLRTIPSLDLQFLSLILHFKVCWEKVASDDGLAPLLHRGAQEVFMRAQNLTRQKAAHFDRLISLLTINTTGNHLLFMEHNLMEHLSDAGEEQQIKYLQDLIRRLQSRFINEKIKLLQDELKRKNDRIKLEEINNLMFLKKQLSQSTEPLTNFQMPKL